LLNLRGLLLRGRTRGQRKRRGRKGRIRKKERGGRKTVMERVHLALILEFDYC